MTTFADRLRSLRAEKDMTQADLGKVMNVSTSTIGYWENGTGSTSLAIAACIADFFGVSLDYLIGKTDYRHLDIPKERLQEPLAVLMHGEAQKLSPEAQIEIAKYIKYQIWKERTGETPS